MPSNPPHTDTEQPEKNLVEVGWLLAGEFESADLQAIDQAREQCLALLTTLLPDFQWQMPKIVRRELVLERQVKPPQVLDAGVRESGPLQWDFTIIITSADLAGIYRENPVAVLSRALEAVVVSTARIDPLARDPHANEEERIATMSAGLLHVALHGLGHLSGLGPSRESGNAMFMPSESQPFSHGTEFSPQQLETVHKHLQEVADSRLEEREGSRHAHAIMFYVAAVWLNLSEITRAIRQARAWEFPFRLSRLTTAAAGAALVMLMTAEVWELGSIQSAATVGWLSLGTLLVTTAYIVARQRLIVHRGHAGLSEQEVLTNVSTVGIVLLGITFTYVLFYAITFGLCLLLFPESLVANWTATENVKAIPLATYAIVAGFITAVGLLIGSLGASFEEQNYFRHITLIDEEL